jgi:YbbR domain-containing protein
LKVNPLHNIILKASAVALALLLWVHVATNKTYEYQLNLPLKVVNVPKGLVLVSETPSIVAIKVRATGKQLLLLSNSGPIVAISAVDCKAGTTEKIIGASEMTEALGRSFENAEALFPRSLTLKLEKEVEKRLSIRSAVRAEAGPGFALVSAPRIEPDTITVTGPASIMHQLKHLETVSLPWIGLTASTSKRVNLALPESLHLSVRDSSVTVRVEIEGARQKAFSNLAIIPPAGFPSGRYDIVPAHLTFVVEIPQSKYSSVTADNISASFRRPLLVGDTVGAEIEYTLPPGVQIVGAHIDSVTLIKKQ